MRPVPSNGTYWAVNLLGYFAAALGIALVLVVLRVEPLGFLIVGPGALVGMVLAAGWQLR